MPVSQIQFVKTPRYAAGAFRVSLVWRADIGSVLLIACPRHEHLDIDDVLSKKREGVRLDELNAHMCPKGSDTYEFCPVQLIGQWLDIYAIDCDNAGGAIQIHSPVTHFYGTCVVAYSIKPSKRVSANMKSVHITLENRSMFDIPARSLGYRVDQTVYTLPMGLKRGELRSLPQIEIPADRELSLTQLPSGLPVSFQPIAR